MNERRLAIELTDTLVLGPELNTSRVVPVNKKCPLLEGVHGTLVRRFERIDMHSTLAIPLAFVVLAADTVCDNLAVPLRLKTKFGADLVLRLRIH